ncbi:MAG: DUF4384 domain-containing protein [Candidatus Kryptoniota bacterium]
MKLIFTFIVLNTTIALAQNSSVKKWYDGEGTATGNDMEKIHTEALSKARSDALQKAGIEVVSGTLSLKSEEDNKLIDFFSEFTESNSRGLILDEKVRFDKPIPVDSSYTVYRLTAHVHALVGIPEGEIDPSFEVKLTVDRDTYKEYEPVTMRIKTTKPGYLTILDIHGDSVNVLFPNAIDRNNYISAGTDFVFPQGKSYRLEFETENGKQRSTDMIIAVVTIDRIPFQNIEKINLEGSKLMTGQKSLIAYAKWLYRIPLNRRSLAYRLVHVERGTRESQ